MTQAEISIKAKIELLEALYRLRGETKNIPKQTLVEVIVAAKFAVEAACAELGVETGVTDLDADSLKLALLTGRAF